MGPDWKTSGKYTYRNYEIKVDTGTVQSVKDLTTNSTINKVAGTDKYQFKLGAPSVTGKVMEPLPGNTAVRGVMITPQVVGAGGVKGDVLC